MKRSALVLVLVLVVVSGCVTSTSGRPAERVVVFAAASLTDAFEELAAAYAAETGTDVILSVDASSALRTQISEGASADLFASADLANPQELVDAGLTEGGVRAFAGNGLALVVPADGDRAVTAWQDLATDGVRIVAAGTEVPITAYAEQLVGNLAERADAPDGFADAYAANIVSREDNVRAVLAKVELGEGDAGVVYETDAAASDGVTRIALPSDATVVAEYGLVLLADASPPALALADWLLDVEAQGILAAHGFRPPGR